MPLLDRIKSLLGRHVGADAPASTSDRSRASTGVLAGTDGFVYCIDSMGCVNGSLVIKGWALHERLPLSGLELSARLPSGESVSLTLEYGHARDDISQAVPQSPDAMYSGFSARASNLDCDDVQLVIRMSTEGDGRSFDVGLIDNLPFFCRPENRSGVLVLTDRTEGACRRYRAEHLAEELARSHVDVALTDVTQLATSHSSCKHLVLQRAFIHALIPELVDYFKSGGGLLLFELDDALFNYGFVMENDYLRCFPEWQKEQVEILRKLMASSDALITSTLPLAELMEAEFPDKPVFLNPNVASDEMISLGQTAYEARAARTDDGPIRLGYFSGSATHNRDFEVLLEPLMSLMADDERVRLCVVGEVKLPEELEASFSGRIERLAPVPWQELPQLIASVDVNLLPLEDTRFNECKSAIKWMEAALVGVPTISSRNRELEREIAHGKTGILCSDETEWEAALRSLASDASLRARIGEAARAEVLARHTTASMNPDLLDFLRG